MNRHDENEELNDPRLGGLATGDAPADVQADARAALAGLRQRMERRESNDTLALLKTMLNLHWAKLAWAGSFAAAVVAVVMFLGRPDVAFADVAARLRTAKTMIYQAVIQIEGTQPVPETMHLQFYFKQPSLVRSGFMDGTVWTVMNTDTQKGISVQVPQKTFTDLDGSGIPPDQFNAADLIQKMRSLPDRADKDLGKRKFGNRVLHGFFIHEEGKDMTVWADPETGDPVKIEVSFPQIKWMTRTLYDFKFDVPLDNSLFNMTPPAGFTRMQLKLQVPSQEDLLWFLSNWSNGEPNHEFPLSLSPVELEQNPHYDHVIAAGFGDPKSLSKQQQLEIGVRVGRVFQFPLLLVRKEGEWHYVGAGVRRGDPAPICWWREKDAKFWHVIYGDLKTADVPLKDWPKMLEKVKRIDAETSSTQREPRAE